ncbi:MAG TPA: nucleotide exchange factor GrpE [Terracidiphilus sp.]|nr:nucleotide exchange factor GrpE [Terracidiphilus sp.]
MPEQQTIREEDVQDNASAAESAAADAATSETGTVPATGAATAGEPPSADEKIGRPEYDQLKQERDQLVDRLARLQAEFENARKRAERERADYRDYAAASVVEQFLPVLDNFELALKAAGSTEQLRSGVELIVKQMEEVLRQMQVTAIPTVGEQFDPRHHEALGTVEREDLPDQHVAEEIRRGYKIREKLLRPAMVRVVSNPKQTVE